MYRAMRFADYIVSHALRVNSDCLQYLAVTTDSLARGDLHGLHASLAQLRSLWQLMRWSVGRDQHRSALARLDEAGALLPADDAWVGNAASQLAERAGGGKVVHTVELIRLCLLEQQMNASACDLDRLGVVLQQESECWRERQLVRATRDRDLVEQGIGGAYRRARRMCRRFVDRPAAPKRLRRASRWVGHCVDHLELLRPALSDGNVARAWFLRNLGNNLRTQCDLQRFLAEAQGLAEAGRLQLKPKDLARLDQWVRHRCRRLAGRSAKFVAEGLCDDRETFVAAVAADVETLKLEEITLLPVGSGLG